MCLAASHLHEYKDTFMKPDVLLLLRLPEDLKAGKVPLVHAEVGAADDVAPIELQAGLEADAAVLRHRQRLQTLAIDFSAQGPHLQGARRGTGGAPVRLRQQQRRPALYSQRALPLSHTYQHSGGCGHQDCAPPTPPHSSGAAPDGEENSFMLLLRCLMMSRIVVTLLNLKGLISD